MVTAHTLYWDWPDGLDEPQLFLDGEPEVIAPQPPTWRVFLKSLDAKDYTSSCASNRSGLNQVSQPESAILMGRR